MIVQAVRQSLTWVGSYTAHPAAFFIVVLYGIGWWFFERDTLDWHAVATLATWMMTLFIQRAEHRDTQAMHAKLDELLHAHGKASNSLTKLDDVEPEEIERHRKTARAQD